MASISRFRLFFVGLLEPSSSAPSIDRHNNFNLIRLVLAVLVILHHSGALVDGDNHRMRLLGLFAQAPIGDIAVDGFFLLSGFLILQSWQRNPRPGPYFRKRILRIYPGFVAAVLLSALVVGPLGAPWGEYFSHFKIWDFVKSVLLLRAPDVPPVFAGTHFRYVNGSLWTIEYEFRCYILVAFFGMLGLAKRKRVWLLILLVAISAVLLPKVTALLWFHGTHTLLGIPLTLMRLLSFFSAGCCFYLFHPQIRYTTKGALIALPLFALCLVQAKIAAIVLPMAGAYLLFWFAFRKIPVLKNFGNRSDISYGTYLYGWPAQKLLNWYFPLLAPMGIFVLATGVSFGCAWGSWHCVERPFLKMKPRRVGIAPTPEGPASIPKEPGNEPDCDLSTLLPGPESASS